MSSRTDAEKRRGPGCLDDDLVAEGLVESIPVIPDVAGAKKGDLRYRVNGDRVQILMEEKAIGMVLATELSPRMMADREAWHPKSITDDVSKGLAMMSILRPLAALAAIAVLASCLSTLRADGPPRDTFAEADFAFRDLYAQARAATLEKIGPVIVVEMDKLILLHSGERSESTAIPPVYHRLKAISHVPLAIYVALAPFGDAPVVGDRLARLRDFRARIDEMSKALKPSALSDEQVERSTALLRRSATFLDGVLEKGQYEAAALRTLARSAAPVVLANADDAVKSQIDAYHAQVSAWRRQIPEEQWSKLHVVVLGPQMPRKHNVPVQYFAKLLGQAGESRRLVYAEQSSGETQALNLLATHRLDSELSVAFFGDTDRMEIDLLGNAASVYLDRFDIGR